MSNEGELPDGIAREVRQVCLCLNAQAAARALARRFDEALRPAGLTSGQYSLLMSLNQPEPPGLGRVAELLAMDRTTVTANLKPLVRDGLATVSPDPRDKRGRILILTSKGRAALAAALPIWRRTLAEVEARVGPDVEVLRAGLRALA